MLRYYWWNSKKWDKNLKVLMWFVSNNRWRPLFIVFVGLYAIFLAMPYSMYIYYHNISQISYYLYNHELTFSFTTIRYKLVNHNHWNSNTFKIVLSIKKVFYEFFMYYFSLNKNGEQNSIWTQYVKMASKIPFGRSMFRSDMKSLHYYYIMIGIVAL